MLTTVAHGYHQEGAQQGNTVLAQARLSPAHKGRVCTASFIAPYRASSYLLEKAVGNCKGTLPALLNAKTAFHRYLLHYTRNVWHLPLQMDSKKSLAVYFLGQGLPDFCLRESFKMRFYTTNLHLCSSQSIWDSLGSGSCLLWSYRVPRCCSAPTAANPGNVSSSHRSILSFLLFRLGLLFQLPTPQNDSFSSL